MEKEVRYLGHRIDKHGIYPTEEKVQRRSQEMLANYEHTWAS